MRHAIPESKTLLSEMNIEVFCTTDDLTSSLETHEQAESALDTDVRPTWGLDRALHIGRNSWHTFVDQLEHATDTATSSFLGFLELSRRHTTFDAHGCRASDSNLEQFVTHPVSQRRTRDIYRRALEGRTLAPDDVTDVQAFLVETATRLSAESPRHASGVENTEHTCICTATTSIRTHDNPKRLRS